MQQPGVTSPHIHPSTREVAAILVAVAAVVAPAAVEAPADVSPAEDEGTGGEGTAAGVGGNGRLTPSVFSQTPNPASKTPAPASCRALHPRSCTTSTATPTTAVRRTCKPVPKGSGVMEALCPTLPTLPRRATRISPPPPDTATRYSRIYISNSNLSPRHNSSRSCRTTSADQRRPPLAVLLLGLSTLLTSTPSSRTLRNQASLVLVFLVCPVLVLV